MSAVGEAQARLRAAVKARESAYWARAAGRADLGAEMERALNDEVNAATAQYDAAMRDAGMGPLERKPIEQRYEGEFAELLYGRSSP